jgi:hypothetical protein
MVTVRIVAFSLVTILVLLAASLTSPITAGGPGTTDFVQYWAAWRLMLEGANPYDPELLTKVQSTVNENPGNLIFSWNPPWTFVALSPILSLPFNHAASLWFAVQIALLAVISIAAPRGLGASLSSPLKGVLATVLFFPILHSMKMGQLGPLFAASIALFLWFLRAGALRLAGISLLPLTFKPHLFFLFFVPGIIWLKQLSPRDRARFLSGSFGALGLLVVASIAVSPSSSIQWLNALGSKAATSANGLAVHVNDWQTATLVTWIRRAIAHQTNTLVTWPMWAVPLSSLILSGVYFYRRATPIRWEIITPALLCLSLGTSNYGWVFDQSVLVLCQIALVCEIARETRNTPRLMMSLVVAAIQGFSVYCSIWLDPSQEYYAWVPWAYLVALWAARRLLEGPQLKGPQREGTQREVTRSSPAL